MYSQIQKYGVYAVCERGHRVQLEFQSPAYTEGVSGGEAPMKIFVDMLFNLA